MGKKSYKNFNISVFFLCGDLLSLVEIINLIKGYFDIYANLEQLFK